MSNIQTPGDELTGDEDIIRLDDVTARIKYLEERDCHEPDPDGEGCDSVYACPSCYGDAGEELAALRDLAAEMHPDYARSAIRESYLTEFVQDEADDIEGIGPDSYLFSYIQWDELADSRTTDMTATTFRGTAYYITS